MACVPSEDSDQPGRPPSLIRVFSVRMADAQADLSLRWAHMSFCYFRHEVAHFKTSIFFLFLYILPYALADILGRSGLQDEGLQVTILNFRGVL